VTVRLPVVLFRALLLVLATLVTVLPTLSSVGVLPDLVLPVVVAGALLSGPSRGALLGLAAGWLTDLVPPGSAVLGTAALVYAAAGLLAGAGRREGHAPWGWVAAVVTASAAVVQALRLVVAVLSGEPVSWGVAGLDLVATATLGVVLVPALVGAEQWLSSRWSR
jgi:rod shape-determining protein MreD